MAMGIKEAARRLAREDLTDLFFVSMVGGGKIFAGFQCPHGPDMISNVRLYFEQFSSELSIAKAMADGIDTTGMGTVRDLVKGMMAADITEEELCFEGDGLKINLEFKITLVTEIESADPKL